jgi:hypothetical protein
LLDCCLGALVFSARADAPVKFDEVFSLVRSNLTGLSEADLNKAAALGFIEKLGGKVELTDPTSSASTLPLIAKTNVFDNSFGYIRLSRIAPGVGQQITDASQSEPQTQRRRPRSPFCQRRGLQRRHRSRQRVRRFRTDSSQMGRSNRQNKTNPDAIKLPVVVLINRQTSGAAEALAGALSISQAALLVGNRTAGQAMAFEDFSAQHRPAPSHRPQPRRTRQRQNHRRRRPRARPPRRSRRKKRTQLAR